MDKKRLNILFLPEWYPTNEEGDKRTGIFCKEHAQAIALKNDIVVLNFKSDESKKGFNFTMKKEINDGITVYQVVSPISPVPKTSRWLIKRNFDKALKQVIKEIGTPDLFYTHDRFGFFTVDFAKKYNIPFVFSQHWTGFMKKILKPAEELQFKRVFEEAKFVLAANKFAEQDYKHYGLSCNFRWFPNVYDDKLFYYEEKIERENILLHASGFSDQKRVEDIIEAYVSLETDAVLHFAGDGKQRKKYEKMCEGKLKPDSYVFHGHMEKEDLGHLMRKSKGFLFPSEYETFGCVLMEAMACGLPVLTTKVGGIPAVVPEELGNFVEVGNVKQIAETMKLMLNGEAKGKYTELRDYAFSNFNYDVIGAAFDKIARESIV